MIASVGNGYHQQQGDHQGMSSRVIASVGNGYHQQRGDSIGSRYQAAG